MKNISQNQHSVAPTTNALPTTWSKPQLTVTPLNQALSGGNFIFDGFGNAGVANFAS